MPLVLWRYSLISLRSTAGFGVGCLYLFVYLGHDDYDQRTYLGGWVTDTAFSIRAHIIL